MIAVAATERFKGGLRVTFVCGGRALSSYRALRDAVAGSVRALSVLPAELPGAIERLQNESREQRRQIKDLQGTLAGHEADGFANRAVDTAAGKVVALALTGWDAAGLKTIASRIVERPGYLVVLVGEPPTSPIVVARSAGVAADAGAMLKQLIQRHGGKGGGRPEMAQGGGLTSAAADVVQSALEILRS
jgi:alanyl-tRNA synthetase